MKDASVPYRIANTSINPEGIAQKIPGIILATILASGVGVEVLISVLEDNEGNVVEGIVPITTPPLDKSMMSINEGYNWGS